MLLLATLDDSWQRLLHKSVTLEELNFGALQKEYPKIAFPVGWSQQGVILAGPRDLSELTPELMASCGEARRGQEVAPRQPPLCTCSGTGQLIRDKVIRIGISACLVRSASMLG